MEGETDVEIEQFLKADGSVYIEFDSKMGKSITNSSSKQICAQILKAASLSFYARVIEVKSFNHETRIYYPNFAVETHVKFHNDSTTYNMSTAGSKFHI